MLYYGISLVYIISNNLLHVFRFENDYIIVIVVAKHEKYR